MYSQRASSRVSILFSDGMALKSKVSRVLTMGKRAALIRLWLARCSLSISSASARRSKNPMWSTFSRAHCLAVFSDSLSMVGSFSFLR